MSSEKVSCFTMTFKEFIDPRTKFPSFDDSKVFDFDNFSRMSTEPGYKLFIWYPFFTLICLVCENQILMVDFYCCYFNNATCSQNSCLYWKISNQKKLMNLIFKIFLTRLSRINTFWMKQKVSNGLKTNWEFFSYNIFQNPLKHFMQILQTFWNCCTKKFPTRDIPQIM